MSRLVSTWFRLIVLGVLCGLAAASRAAPYVDRLDLPAELAPRAAKSEMYGITRVAGTGTHVAVGIRGHVLLSTDKGQSWTQSPSPLSSPLIAACFPTPRSGWIVGHDGVVMHSNDGGKNWERQLDGRKIGDIMVAWYEKQLPSDDAVLLKALEDAKRFKDEGPSKPFLDVYFESELSGWAIGNFNMIVKTDDGGKTWEPWLDRIENPQGYSLHAMASVDGELYIVGELGLALRFDRQRNRFVAVKTPYPGTFFHLTGKSGVILLYGLRGNIVRSRDKGATWQTLHSGFDAGLVGGTFLEDGRLVLVSNDGQVLLSNNDGDSFTPVTQKSLGTLSAVVAADDESVLVVGVRGANRLKLK